MNQKRPARLSSSGGIDPAAFAPMATGPCQPPRNRMVIIAHISTMLRYSPSMKRRYGVEPYSTW
jgi:hypothetical protein